MRCPHCCKEIKSNRTVYEYLVDERKELLERKSILIGKKSWAKEKKLWGKYRHFNNEIQKIDNRIPQLKAQIKKANQLAHQEAESRERYLIKILMDELKTLGYDRSQLQAFGNQADELYIQTSKNARDELAVIHSEYERSKHNDWHTETGIYDPTGKLGTDNKRRK